MPNATEQALGQTGHLNKQMSPRGHRPELWPEKQEDLLAREAASAWRVGTTNPRREADEKCVANTLPSRRPNGEDRR
jgi:hypothetical protein